MAEPYRVLVVDDSAFMRKVVSDIIDGSGAMTVAGVAANGAEALEAVERLKPDVVTMDVEMPVMTGLEALPVLLGKASVPVIMLSSTTAESASKTIRALELGAFDFVAKPSGAGSGELPLLKQSLLASLHAAVQSKIEKQQFAERAASAKDVPESLAEAAGNDASGVPPAAGGNDAGAVTEPPAADGKKAGAAPERHAAGAKDAGAKSAGQSPERQAADANRAEAPPERPAAREKGTTGGPAQSAAAGSPPGGIRPRTGDSPRDRIPPAPADSRTKTPSLKDSGKERTKPARDAAPGAKLTRDAATGGKPPRAPVDSARVPKAAPPEPRREEEKPPAAPAVKRRPAKRFVAIGTSTGGPRALQQVLTSLPEKLPAALLIVQHMPPGFTKSLAQRLNTLCAVEVTEAEDGMEPMQGTAYIAPGGRHMVLRKEEGGYRIRLNDDPPLSGHRPSVDKLFESLALLPDLDLTAVLMTGMGSDGARGMKRLYDQGVRRTIAQDAASCIVYGMPRSAVELGCVASIVPLDGIAAQIMNEVS